MAPRTTADMAMIGQRVYLIRLALGDGFKNPMPQQEFSDYLRERGTALDKGDVSRLENGLREQLPLHLLEAIAAVDPLKRGVLWLGWGWDPEAQDPKLAQHLLGKRPPK